MADPTCLALFAGVAGLERGIAAAAGGLRVLAYVEREPYAAAALLARMEDSSLDPAPIWCGDLAELDASPLAGLVDILCAGFPCQPFSVAGKRRGTDDHRWIWPDIAGIIRDVGPGLVFLENVPGLVQHGMPEVLGTLADLGYNRSASPGAATRPALAKRAKMWYTPQSADAIGTTAGTHTSGGGKTLRGDVRGWPTPGSNDWKGSSRPGQRRGQLSEAAEHGLARGLPAPTNSTDGPGSTPKLNPRFVEWLMGFPPGWTDCAASATPSSPPRPNSRSES